MLLWHLLKQASSISGTYNPSDMLLLCTLNEWAWVGRRRIATVDLFCLGFAPAECTQRYIGSVCLRTACWGARGITSLLKYWRIFLACSRGQCQTEDFRVVFALFSPLPHFLLHMENSQQIQYIHLHLNYYPGAGQDFTPSCLWLSPPLSSEYLL